VDKDEYKDQRIDGRQIWRRKTNRRNMKYRAKNGSNELQIQLEENGDSSDVYS